MEKEEVKKEERLRPSILQGEAKDKIQKVLNDCYDLIVKKHKEDVVKAICDYIDGPLTKKIKAGLFLMNSDLTDKELSFVDLLANAKEKMPIQTNFLFTLAQELQKMAQDLKEKTEPKERKILFSIPTPKLSAPQKERRPTLTLK